MSYVMIARRVAGVMPMAATVFGLAVFAALPAFAQDDATKKDETAKKDEKTSSWVKLCEKAKIKKDEAEKEVCITHHERLDPNNGAVVVSAAIRKIEGQEKSRFLVTVPLGMAIPPGMQAKIDEAKNFYALKYTFCLPNGCTAEMEATAELIKELEGGKVITVASINALGETIGFQVPLNGFKETLAGKPIDTAKFAKAREQLLMRIREKQIERAKAAKEAKDAAKDGKATEEKKE